MNVSKRVASESPSYLGVVNAPMTSELETATPPASDERGSISMSLLHRPAEIDGDDDWVMAARSMGTAAATMYLPMATASPRRRPMVWALLALAVAGLACATALALLLTRTGATTGSPDTATPAVEPSVVSIPDSPPAVAPSTVAVAPRSSAKRRRRAAVPSLGGATPSASGEAEDATRCPDEIACSLAARPPACCARHRAATGSAMVPTRLSATAPPTAAVAPPSTVELPEAPTRDAIATATRSIRDAALRCGDLHEGPGLVQVRIAVAPSGAVKTTTMSSPSAKVGACVAAAASKARFAPTREGVVFVYPVAFK